MAVRICDGAVALGRVDPRKADTSMDEPVARPADPPKIARHEADGHVVEHLTGRPLRRSSFQAEQLAGAAFLALLLATLLVEGAMVAAVDQDRPLGSEYGKTGRDPVPHRLLMNSEQPRRLFDCVALMDLGEPRIELALAGHGSRRAVFDELADVFRAPSRDPRAEFDRLGVAA